MPLHLFVLEALASMGYTRSEIEDSLGQAKYDDVFATYLLLGRKTTDVSKRGEARISMFPRKMKGMEERIGINVVDLAA